MLNSFSFINILPIASDDPRIGTPAPNFEAQSTSGKTVKLSDFKGSWVVFYFYPASFTPGCVSEACALRDSYSKITEIGVILPGEEETKPKDSDVIILGVSTNDIETQYKFKKEYNLPFDLLSDKDKKIAKAYDVLKITGLAAERKTFIINPDGKIAYIFDKVNAGKHDQEVMEVLEELKKK
jgi:thioredoxin-dependent peroxiredoxin